MPYGFIGNPPSKVAVESLTDVRERFLRFFERHGHARIKRYPVVARWRDDVYLVGASIYDFQPWVTSGAVPPPANPLTISQPSIRLTDVDKVGRSGRHLTGFEMMAHHAFNYPDKFIYWIDETTEYATFYILYSQSPTPRGMWGETLKRRFFRVVGISEGRPRPQLRNTRHAR